MDAVSNDNDRGAAGIRRRSRAARLWVAAALAGGAPAAVFLVSSPPTPTYIPAGGAARLMTAAAPPVETSGLPQPGGRSGGSRGPRGPGWSGPTTQPGQAPQEVKWADVSRFMEVNSPRKWAMFEKLDKPSSPDKPSDWEWKQRMRAGIGSRYAELKKLENEDKPAYDLEVQRIGIEDGMFGAMADYRTAQNEDQRKKFTDVMRQWAGEFVENRQNERRLRLSQLNAQAEKLQKEISKVDESRDAEITTLTNRNLAPAFGGRGHHRGAGDHMERGGERHPDRPEKNDKGDRGGENRERPD